MKTLCVGFLSFGHLRDDKYVYLKSSIGQLIILYILSRGGYRKLEEKIMSKKKKSRSPPSEGEDIEPPSPPSHHQKWKLARLRTSGNYASESAREISEKIVRYNSSLNIILVFYIVLFFITFFLLHCRIC